MRSVRRFTKKELKLISDNYTVYEDGRIFSKRRNKFLSPGLRNGEYYGVTFSVNFIQFQVQVHRIVAIFHIPNPNKYPVINHIDGNKLNNHISNLEWCTDSHNLRHARLRLKKTLT